MPSLPFPTSLHAAPVQVRRGLVVAVAVALALVGQSWAAEAPRDKLAEVEERIAATLGELDEVAARSDSSEEALADAQAAVERLEEALNEVLAAVQEQERAVAAAQAEADAAIAERERVERLATARARSAFMGGVPDDLLLLSEVSGDDLEGALDRLALLDTLAARDAAAIESLDVVRVQATTAAERLEVALDELAAARDTQQQLLAAAERVFVERADALASLESQRERLLAEQEQLEGEQDDLQELIRRQEEEEARRRAEEEARRRAEEEARRRAEEEAEQGEESGGGSTSEPPPPPPSSSGCYARPTAGAVTSEYGPRWGRMHEGMDFDGDTGDAIVAAQDGVVTFAGYQGGYGQLTLVRHADGVTTAYAHQSSVGVSAGQAVARGQYLGAIGTSGNVTGSHLHFETRTSSGAQNPRNYLC